MGEAGTPQSVPGEPPCRRAPSRGSWVCRSHSRRDQPRTGSAQGRRAENRTSWSSGGKPGPVPESGSLCPGVFQTLSHCPQGGEARLSRREQVGGGRLRMGSFPGSAVRAVAPLTSNQAGGGGHGARSPSPPSGASQPGSGLRSSGLREPGPREAR